MAAPILSQAYQDQIKIIICGLGSDSGVNTKARLAVLRHRHCVGHSVSTDRGCGYGTEPSERKKRDTWNTTPRAHANENGSEARPVARHSQQPMGSLGRQWAGLEGYRPLVRCFCFPSANRRDPVRRGRGITARAGGFPPPPPHTHRGVLGRRVSRIPTDRREHGGRDRQALR